MRLPLRPIRPPLPPLHAGPAVAGAEHLGEIVHPVEVLGLVARLAGQLSDVDQRDDDAAQVVGAGATPVGEDGPREQCEVVERERAAGPGELGPGEVAPRGELPLRVLERRQHEQVAALGVAPLLLPDAGERLLQRGEVAHGRASLGPEGRARTATGRVGRGSSSASSSTSSIVSTALISSSCFTSSGTSTMSPWLRAGTSTFCTPARAAAVSFSLRPPMGSTRRRRVSPPVSATACSAGRRHDSYAPPASR